MIWITTNTRRRSMLHKEEYRDVLEDLAISRGLSGAEELAQRAGSLDPEYTVQGLLENPPGGYGRVLDQILTLSEEEKVRLANSFAWTFLGGGVAAE
jgi:hypothetical protein